MLIVKFNCVDYKADVPTLDKEKYINNIFTELSKEGFITSILIANSNKCLINDQVIHEKDPDVYILRYVFEDKNSATNKSSVIDISFTWGTYQSCLQLSIAILSENYALSPSEEYVEKLKIKIKKIINKDWRKIEWLFDKDSECLAVDLYPNIFRTENLIRQMISELLSKYFGASWWEKFIACDIKDKYSSRQSGYKRIAPSFANIDDYLLSIDLGDLLKIISLQYVKWNPQFEENINLMLSGKTKWNSEGVKKILENQTTVEIDFWGEYFSKYLSPDFKDKLSEFDKNRNHVAHNKILDRQAYRTIKGCVEVVKDDVRKAIQKISEDILSNEEKERIEQITALQEAEREETYERMIELEAGVEIRHSDEIQEILEEHYLKLCTTIEDTFCYREDIDIYTNLNKIDVFYKISNEHLTFTVSFDINEEQGASSCCDIKLEGNNDFNESFAYINGEVEYNDDQMYYMPTTMDEMPDSDAVAESLVDYINDACPNLRQMVDDNEFRRIKDGESPLVVDDIQCDECGDYYIAADDTYAEMGTCLNCGAFHVIHQCIRCNCFFEGAIDDDFPELCDDCLEAFEEE